MATVKTTATGAGWAPGTVNTAFVPCSALTGTWTYTASADVPSGSTSTGYISLAENAAGTLKLDADYSSELNADGTDVWVSIWAKCDITTAASVPADATAISGDNFMRFGASLFRSYPVTVRGTDGTFPANYPGMTFTNARTIGTLTTEQLTTASGDPALIAFGVWTKYTAHVKRASGTGGMYEMIVNGDIIGRVTGMDTHSGSGGITVAEVQGSSGNGWTWQFPAIPGCTWRVAGPIQSVYGSDYTGIRPLWSTYAAATDKLTAVWKTTFLDRPCGGYFSTALTGTAAVTPTVYATTGQNPRRTRAVMSLANLDTCTFTSYDNIGTLPWNSKGVATIHFPLLFAPANSTMTQVVKDQSGNAVFTIALNGTNVTIQMAGQSAVTLGTHTPANRYAVAVHLDNGGNVTATLHNLSLGATATTQRVWSAIAGTWTPVDLGVAVATFTGTGASAPEYDGLELYRWWTVCGSDSYSSTIINGLSVAQVMPNHFAQAIAPGFAVESYPGGAYRHRGVLTGRMRFTNPLGYTGSYFTTHFWETAVGPGLTYTRGTEFWLLGGAINDVLNVTPRATMVANYETDLRAFARYCEANGNRLVMVTNVRPEQETSISTTVSAGTATVTENAHGRVDATTTTSFATFVDNSTTTFNQQSVGITYATANTYTYATSLTGSGVTGKARRFSDDQLYGLGQCVDVMRRVATEENKTGAIFLVDIANSMCLQTKLFSGGDDAHPNSTTGRALIGTGIAAIGPTNSAAPTGYKRQGKKDNWFKHQ